ncbi:hypothetical protein [Paenibacillus sp. MBLB4367]|uniref:hypothetical protein n=1 Tax=Paenibacillus sp. MBLB4367 TaxID=3384767 RepID=UPI00390827BC
MMQVVDINVDRTELILTVDNGKRVASQTVAFDKVLSIRFSKETVKKWFSTKVVRRIELYTKDKEEPYSIGSDKVKSFDAIEEYIRQLAEKHQIPLEQA